MLCSARDALKIVASAILVSVALTGCGSGSSGSADLNKGPSVESPPPPVTNTVSFNDIVNSGSFVAGEPPTHARFAGGEFLGNGAWIIPAGQTGVVDFATPADAVKFPAQDSFVVAAAAGAAAAGDQKATYLARAQSKVDAPFDIPMYVRGSVQGDWAALPENQMQEVADNVLEVTIPVEAGSYEFKVADAGWTGPTNCGADTDPTPIPVGSVFTGQCDALSQNLLLTIAETGDYVFTFDITNQDEPKFKVDLKTDDGGGGQPPTEPDNTIEIRIYAVDVLTEGAEPALLKTLSGFGRIEVDELLTGGSPRITRVEIENLGGAGDVGIEDFSWTANPRFAPDEQPVDIYYSRPSGSVEGTTVTVDGIAYDCLPTTDSAFGCVASGVPVFPYANEVMTVSNADGTSEFIAFNAGPGEDVYAFSGGPVARSGAPGDPAQELAALPRTANEVILFYKREDNSYDGWGLHLFPLDPQGDAWTLFPTPGEFPPEGIDPQWGAYFRIALPGQESPPYSNNPPAADTFPTVLGFIIHKGEQKDPGPDQMIRISEDGTMVFVVSGVNDVSSVPPGGGATLRVSGASAHWVDQATILWSPAQDVTDVELLYSADASILAGIEGILGDYETFELTSGTNPQPAFNQLLNDLDAWSLPAAAVERARELARGQLVMIGRDVEGNAIQSTLVQTAGALDALYADAASARKLGVDYGSGVPALSVWAPTALIDPGVSVNLYEASGSFIESVPMTLDETSGVWSVTGTAEWDRKFYTVSLNVYSYATDSIVSNEVTDPYSVSLSTDSSRSQFVNLDDADLKPAGWDTLTPPALAAPEDIVVYELHVRDFSIADTSVPDGDRGKFTAFDTAGTTGRNQLQQLADAGLTHVHVLPAFDFATVKEDPASRVELNDPVEDLCAANPDAASLCTTDAGKTILQAMEDAVAANQLDRPQQISEWLRDLDGFNWGYDPLHYGVPEGSYSTDPNGAARILEFRRMVKGLNELGLRTVLDVVYNHTNASGQNVRATLDRLVPGYYHRRDVNGGTVLKNSCCDDTAPEFRMMEKLVTDTGVIWARDYKITGFRFDLMSMHPLDGILRFRDAVQAVDSSVHIYGEGWNCCGVEDDKRFVAARQANLGGTGIGSFSDRIRDPVRGGGPFDSGTAYVTNQGFINGWYYDPNAQNSGSTEEREALIADTDNIRTWLAGGLAGYRFVDATGTEVSGSDVDYRGQQSGYTEDPQEAVNYISKHDNQTLWDISNYKHPAGTLSSERTRAQNVGLSLVLLGQGVPFVHAGSEMLRSKSGDRNSYDSGDWFNALDWTRSRSTWNQGLPNSRDNAGEWSILTDKYLDVTTTPMPGDKQRAFDHVREMLQIRASSPLFRLRTRAQIDKRVKFYNTGPFQVPGVIAMGIDGCSEPDLTASEGALMVVFNASDDDRTISLFGGDSWSLHPVLATSTDAVVQTARHDANGFYVPARTTAVFRRANQTSCAPYPRDLFVRGGFNDWAAADAYRLGFLGGADYSVSAPVSEGSWEFKIADNDWTGDTNCGAGAAGGNVQLGIPLTLACFSDSGNLGMTAPSTGDYTFSLEASDTANPVLTVTKSPPVDVTLFVRGGFNDWGNGPAPTAPLAWDGLSTYRVVIPDLTAASYEFKIADSDWSGPTNCGGATGGTSVTLGQPYPLSCFSDSQNIGVTFPADGSYLFAIDSSNPASLQLTVEKVPVDVPVFVRGIAGDWSDGAQNQMSYLGSGIYSINKFVASETNEFKIASSDWATVDCGGGGDGTNVTVGSPLALACGSGTPNLTLTPPAGGTYNFQFNRQSAEAGVLTVTGP